MKNTKTVKKKEEENNCKFDEGRSKKDKFVPVLNYLSTTP
jgi:hypothetical protein